MDDLPVEVIGNILSQLGAARDVVVASATCRKWREAWRTHLHALSFDSNDWPAYHDILPSRLEIVITQTIFQTRGLESLSILMDDLDEFSAAPVIAWLLYTRDSLRELCYNVRTTPNVNIIEKCGRHKLEVLSLVHNSIIGFEPSYQKFPRLRSLSLSYVSISAMDLSLLLNVCPKLEVLKLINPDIADVAISDSQTMLELSSTSLRDVYIEGIGIDKVILEGDYIEKLNLKDCTQDLFLFVGKGGLRVLKIDDVSVLRLDIGENTDNLEVIDVRNFTIMWPIFCRMISRSQKLRNLRLWGVVFDYDDEIVDLENVAVLFPQLRHLSLSYDVRGYMLPYGSHLGASCFENVVVLELGWTTISDFFIEWLSGLLERCPNLKQLVIYGVVSGLKTPDECSVLACFTSSIVQLMRIYAHVEVSFEFE